MGRRGLNPTMPHAAASLVMLLMVLDGPVFSSARFVVNNLSSGAGFRRGLSESNEPLTVAVDLMHAQHVDSPYMQPNLTLLQRAQNAAKSSKQRLRYLSGKISRKNKSYGVSRVVSSPVSSQQGDYVMQISTGTPARTFTVFVDTGSDLVWLQCSPCMRCFREPDPVFDPSASSSYTAMSCNEPLCVDLQTEGTCTMNNGCHYDYGYADQSFTEGTMAYETFTLTSTDGSTQAFSHIGFGCGTFNEGSNGEFDGLVGLGNGPLSLVSQLGPTIVPVFSYCLVNYSASATTTSPLLLGSAGSSVLTYTPLINTSSFNPTNYYVSLVGITVNSQPVVYPADTFAIDNITGTGGLILDSGTTFTMLYDAAYIPFIAAISAATNYPTLDVPQFDLCYDTSSVTTPVFPAVVFQFNMLNLTMPSDNIFMLTDGRGIYCMYISGAGTPDSSVSVFGNVAQQNFEIAFDIANARVGFAQTTC